MTLLKHSINKLGLFRNIQNHLETLKSMKPKYSIIITIISCAEEIQPSLTFARTELILFELSPCFYSGFSPWL